MIHQSWGPMTIAVAPALNQSGSTAFDARRLADEMAAELAYVEGITVIPVSRVLGALDRGPDARVDEVGDIPPTLNDLGADAMLIFAITEYDPYDPPRIGISAQVIGMRSASRASATPAALSGNVEAGLAVLAQASFMFDASHENVRADIRRFASRRGADDNPYGERLFVVDQTHFMRYCSHAILRRLLAEVAPAPPER